MVARADAAVNVALQNEKKGEHGRRRIMDRHHLKADRGAARASGVLPNWRLTRQSFGFAKIDWMLPGQRPRWKKIIGSMFYRNIPTSKAGNKSISNNTFNVN